MAMLHSRYNTLQHAPLTKQLPDAVGPRRVRLEDPSTSHPKHDLLHDRALSLDLSRILYPGCPASVHQGVAHAKYHPLQHATLSCKLVDVVGPRRQCFAYADALDSDGDP